jgi:integrase
LTEAELVEVWWVCEGLGEFGSIVRLIILTGQRRAEIGDLAWSEIDLDKRMVELPPRRVKNNRPHLIPLSKQAYAIIETMRRGQGRDLVFGLGAGGFSGQKPKES